MHILTHRTGNQEFLTGSGFQYKNTFIAIYLGAQVLNSMNTSCHLTHSTHLPRARQSKLPGETIKPLYNKCEVTADLTSFNA